MTAFTRQLLIPYFAAIALACIVVPWKGQTYRGTSVSYGYSLFFLPPQGPSIPQAVVVDVKMVILELMALTAICALIWIFRIDPKNRVDDPPAERPGRT